MKGARDAETQDLSELDGETQGAVARVDGATGGHEALGDAGNRAPLANAGADQSVLRNQTVTLNGSASFDPDGDALTYTWTQTAGAAVILTDANSSQPHFVAPGAGDVLTFSLVVSDGQTSSVPASTNVSVAATGPSGGLQGKFAQHPFKASITTQDSSYFGKVRVAGNYAYVADTRYGLNIFDVRDPISLALVGTYSMPTSGAQDVRIEGNLAYIAGGSSGLVIIDVSNPTLPTLIGASDAAGAAVSVQLAGTLAYVADSSSGLVIIDVSHPASPTLTGSYAGNLGGASGVQVVGSLAYVESPGGLQVIDVGNPASPVLIGSYNSTILLQAVGVYVVGSLAFVEAYDTLEVIDVSNPTSPSWTGSFSPLPPAIRDSTYYHGVYDVQVVGSYAYIAAGEAGLVVADVSSPASPTLAGSYKLEGYATGVEVVGNHAFVTHDDALGSHSALDVIDVSSLSSPVSTGSYLMPGTAYRVRVLGKHAFVGSNYGWSLTKQYNGGLFVIDVSDPASPLQVGALDVYEADGLDLNAAGTLAFLVTGYLQVIDVSDPAAPTTKSTCSTPDMAVGVEVQEKYAFVADNQSGLQVIDVSDPAAPKVIGAYNSAYPSTALRVVGNYAYVAGSDLSAGVAGEYALQIIDLSNPAAPTLVGACPTQRQISDLDVVGNLAYLAIAKGIQVIDVSSPSAPTLLHAYDTPGYANSVKVSGDSIYVVDKKSGIWMLDGSDPSSPSLAAAYQTPAPAYGMELAGNFAYVADGLGGLQIFELLSLNLTPDLEHAPAGSTQTYTVSWPARAKAPMVKCQVTGGRCAVTSVNLAARQATVQWALPSTPGVHSLSVSVGNWNYFISARDDLEVR